MIEAIRKWIDRHFVRWEWDEYTHTYVRRGWIEQRQSIMDAQYARWLGGDDLGTCTDCREPIGAHPMPDRMWRSGPDLCARVVKRGEK